MATAPASASLHGRPGLPSACCDCGYFPRRSSRYGARRLIYGGARRTAARLGGFRDAPEAAGTCISRAGALYALAEFRTGAP